MSERGWIALYRDLLDKAIWASSTPEQRSVLIAVLLMANHEPKQWEWQGIKFEVQPGQFITSLQKLARSSGAGTSIQNLRSALIRFKNLDFLTYESTKTGRLITVLNWDRYQRLERPSQQRPQQRPNKQVTTNNNEIMKEDIYIVRFNTFYENYPRHEAKAAALKAWLKNPALSNGLFESVMASLQMQKEILWKGREEKFIPLPVTWLKGRRWKDEIPGADPQPSGLGCIKKPTAMTPEDIRALREAND